MSKYSIDELYSPDANNNCTAQAQEILGYILTEVLDASAELDNEKPDWQKVKLHSFNIKQFQNNRRSQL